MYIEITTRCNMLCDHCCMSATAKGKDMNIETFRNAMKIAENYAETIAIGGGEPTIHPFFWQILGEAVASPHNVWIATNGKETTIALALAKMAEKGVIGCALSQDIYHEPIDPSVIEAFTRKQKPTLSYFESDSDYREIRNVTGREIKSGRQRYGKNICACPELFVKTNGDVVSCSCKKAPCFGNVNSKVVVPRNWDTLDCYKNQKEKKKK